MLLILWKILKSTFVLTQAWCHFLMTTWMFQDISLGTLRKKGSKENIRCNFWRVSLKAKGVSAITFIYYLKRKHTINIHKDKVYAAAAANNKPKPTKKNIKSGGFPWESSESKASDTEGDGVMKSGIRRADIRRFFSSNRSKQTALRMFCCKTLFKDKLPFFCVW